MPKLTLHDMPRVAQAQMRAALRRARYGYLRAGMAFCPQEPHRLGGRSRRTNAPRRSDRAGLTAKPCGMPMLCSWQRVSTEEDFFLPDCKDQQELTASMHQVDHVIAEKHGGQTAIENLALSCTV